MEELKKAIIKAAPEIVELKFGCDVILHDRGQIENSLKISNDELYRDKITDWLSAKNNLVRCTMLERPTFQIEKEKDGVLYNRGMEILPMVVNYLGKKKVYKISMGLHYCHYNKIIGRPITLADVLIAINNNTKDRYEGVCISSFGLFSEEYFDGDSWKSRSLDVKWNLKEPLDNQSPECIKFLNKLLVKKGG